MSSDFNDDMLETIGLSKFLGTGKGTKVRLKAVNVEELNDTGIEVATGNIILVGCGELSGQEIFLRATDVEKNEVARLVDVQGVRVGG